ncbi:MAG: HD-GYP domain-containing protein [Solirubrobacteraceae bacterium]|nr:HD-GYP domain-containing protein [Solirubrobacteraceae bacterium]
MDPVAEQLHLERQERINNAPSHRERWVAVVAALLLAVATAGLVALEPPGSIDWATTSAVIVIYAVLWQIDFEVASVSTTPLQLIFVPMWFVVPAALLPAAAVAAQILGGWLSAAIARDRQALRRNFVVGTFAWYALGPALVLALAGSKPFEVGAFWVYAAALAAQFIVDYASSMVRLRAMGRSFTPVRDFLWMSSIDVCLAPIGLLVAIGLQLTPWVVLAVLPLGLLLAQFAKERDERILKAVELSSAYRGTARLMGDVLEADDAYTGGEHTNGVVELALRLGQAHGLNAAQLRKLEFGALLHDIGKLRVPNEIINKPGKLTDEEWAIIRLHPGYGQDMLERVGGQLSDVGVIVRAHHERWDGGGYPDGLAGNEIPIEARIITICDSFSAMTTDRSYRKGMSEADALEEIQRCSGTQFDAALVATLFRELGAPHPRPVLFDPAHTKPSPAHVPSTSDGKASQAA